MKIELTEAEAKSLFSPQAGDPVAFEAEKTRLLQVILEVQAQRDAYAKQVRDLLGNGDARELAEQLDRTLVELESLKAEHQRVLMAKPIAIPEGQEVSPIQIIVPPPVEMPKDEAVKVLETRAVNAEDDSRRWAARAIGAETTLAGPLKPVEPKKIPTLIVYP